MAATFAWLAICIGIASALPWSSEDARLSSRAVSTTKWFGTYVQTDIVSNLQDLHTNDRGVNTVIVASLHLNGGGIDAGQVTLNDDPPTEAHFPGLRSAITALKGKQIKVFALLGGAAQGTYNTAICSNNRNTPDPKWVTILQETISDLKLDGIDLDIEEPANQACITALIKTLIDQGLTVTMAPTTQALLNTKCALSGLDYKQLDRDTGRKIAALNTQFYFGGQSARSPDVYNGIIANGWPADRVVMGVLDGVGSGSGQNWVDAGTVARTVNALRTKYCDFAGLVGWEYFDAGSGSPATNGDPKATWFSTIKNAVTKQVTCG